MKTLASWIAAIWLSCSASTATAGFIVVDFESLRHEDNQVGLHGNSYAEDGFVIDIVNPPETNGLRTLGTAHEHFSGSTSILNGFGGEFLSIREVNNLPFQIASINLDDSGISEDVDATYDITFIGFLPNGGTVENIFAIDNKNGQQTFFFSGFDNVAEVRVRQFPIPHQLDNIVLQSHAVPEPSSLILFAIGCAFFCGYCLCKTGGLSRSTPDLARAGSY